MPRRSFWLPLLGVLGLACGDPWMDPDRMAQRTEVIVLPVPRGPNPPPAYRVAVVETVARAASPDAIFVEVPPAAIERVRRAGAADPWVRAMPDVAALMAIAASSGAKVEPVSGWTPAVGRDWRAFVQRGLPTDPLYERARSHRLREDEDEGDDLEWVLSSARARLVEWEARALEGTVPEALGEAAPSRVGAAHEAVFREALERHAGERILVAIDAKHAPRIERVASAAANVRIVSPLAFEDALDELEDLED